MDEKIGKVNMIELLIRPRRKWWKFYLLPYGTPKQIAKKGLLIMLIGGIPGFLLKGSIIGDLLNIVTALGELLLLVALIIWIKNKFKKKKQDKSMKEKLSEEKGIPEEIERDKELKEEHLKKEKEFFTQQGEKKSSLLRNLVIITAAIVILIILHFIFD